MGKRFLVVGSGGREGIFARRLAKDVQVYAVIGHENPLIVDCVRQSGGQYTVDDANDPQTVLSFAKKHAVDLVFVNADQPLANGVVDALLKNGFGCVGGTRDASRIEWDKIYSMQMVHKVCPEFAPLYRVVSDVCELKGAVSEFESAGTKVVVKPQGLTGGKGVKVMPEHLPTYGDCIDYAASLLEKNTEEKVLLVEKLDGIEFTIMGITDGTNLVLSPASYDYPFRHEDDRGAGTGGMGCFTDSGPGLPFMSGRDLDDCRTIMQRILDEMRSKGLVFNGILNGGFFKTRDGIKFMEFNGRFGDPEVLNILSVLDGSFSELLESICNKTLSGSAVSFLKKASVVKYMVSKEYPGEGEPTAFALDEEAINAIGVEIFFASCVRTDRHQYRTLKTSRVVAFVAVSDTIEEASVLVNEAIDAHVQSKLEYRRDIGSKKSLEKLEKINAEIHG